MAAPHSIDGRRGHGDRHQGTLGAARGEARQGSGPARFLEGGRALVEDEPDTTAWFAVQLGNAQFAIFDAFLDDSGRDAHLSGRVAEALMAQADDLLAQPLDIQKVDVIASKLPA
jgi:quinol monooxygenase YgiN